MVLDNKLLSNKYLDFAPMFVGMNRENKCSYAKGRKGNQMGNKLYKDLEKIRIGAEIAKRESIIANYSLTGFLDRGTVIGLIKNLKETDIDVKVVSSLKEMQCGTIDLNIAPNDTLIFNLQIQLDALKVKLAKIALEETGNGL